MNRFRIARTAMMMLLASLAGGACRTISPPPSEYPIGLFGVNETNDFPMLRAAGFNLVRSPASQPFLDAARESGLSILATPGSTAGPDPFDYARAREIVRRFDGDPAVWGWYLSDEPDLHRTPPWEITRAHRWLKEAGARKPTAIALYGANQVDDYAALTDCLLVDRYPVPWLPLADFGKHLRLARLANGPRRETFAVIQAFDWTHYPDLLPGQGRLRPPSFDEIRAMTFLARVHGAAGLFYYCFDDGRWDIRRDPATWSALQRVVAEVRRLEPLFLARPCWRPVGVHYPDGARRLNEALDPAVAWALVRVEAGRGTVGPGDYLMAVNTTTNAITWQLSWAPPTMVSLPILESDRALPSEGGWFTDQFAPYEVRVYGPMTASSPTE